MNKVILPFVLLVVSIINSNGQQFQTAIYFEDAIGNRDTIVVGFDTTANNTYNPQFGELDLSHPFDSIFEVRAAHLLDFGWGDGDYILSKKIVGKPEAAMNLPTCLYPASILFFVQCANQPITVSWSQDTFSNLFCLSPTFFTPDRLYRMSFPWDWFELPDRRYSCTSFDSTYTLFLDSDHDETEIPYIAMQEVYGSGLDSIWGLHLQFEINWGFSPCQFVDTKLEPEQLDQNLLIFPNPATTEITIHSVEAIKEIMLFDSSGKRIYYAVENGIQFRSVIDISTLTPGLYFAKTIYSSGRVQNGKFVKAASF
jgi:hypothetical protein